MPPFAQEWLNLLVRWIHVIAAIMWIGDSFLFMWLDSHLSTPTRAREGEVVGELWMTHSGGFYELVKRKSLAKNEMPPKLYWFKWESYTTWMTGFLLLIVVYHLNGASLLIDPRVTHIQPYQAVAYSLYLLPIAYIIYEVLWWLIGDWKQLFAVVGLTLMTALAWVLFHVFSARGVFLQIGATLGTIMAANVFFRIIPAQKEMLAATREGRPVDTSFGLRAKGRSIHNHYLTLPVLFCMLSNHFPSLYGAAEPWAVLALIFIFGVGLKYLMNKRLETPSWALAGTFGALLATIVITRPPPDPTLEAYRNKPAVNFDQVSAIIQTRCTACHAERPASGLFDAPPMGVMLDSPENIANHADRIFVRAVSTKTMPLGNITGMSEHERELIGAWFVQGAKIPDDAKMPIEEPKSISTIAQPAADEDLVIPGATPAERAHNYFKTICAGCHGFAGAGDGVAAAALNPKPRNFGDASWQTSVTDQHIRDVITKGGKAMGKSALMPPQPPLAKDPATLDELVKIVRAFGNKK